MTRAVFLGSPPFAVPALRALVDSPFRPALVVTPPDLPRGRGRKLAASEVASLAERAGAPILRSKGAPAPEEIVRLGGGRPDLLVVVSFGAILPAELLELPALGPFNLHASLLPRHRGASPVAGAILAGDAVTGVTVQRMVERLDAGPIVAVEETPIGDRETAGELSARLAEMGGRVVLRALGDVVAGRAVLREQDGSRATVVRRLKREHGRIDWARPALEVDRLVRAMTPWPGAFTTARGRGIAILEGKPAPEREGTPGVVLASGDDGIVVGTEGGAYTLVRLKPEAGREMTAAAFARGRGLAAGDRLGD